MSISRNNTNIKKTATSTSPRSCPVKQPARKQLLVGRIKLSVRNKIRVIYYHNGDAWTRYGTIIAIIFKNEFIAENIRKFIPNYPGVEKKLSINRIILKDRDNKENYIIIPITPRVKIEKGKVL